MSHRERVKGRDTPSPCAFLILKENLAGDHRQRLKSSLVISHFATHSHC
uniref:Uncharacterized protein n=1 Tax=Anguilla anguilla TaxID=7936 RepID=A0A0E9S6L5_ANGAN